jgi:hypothetical protein|tara:strand:+ start:354 stop:578 length:225 start_codon:yes stop_codon:yes gene_type:complete
MSEFDKLKQIRDLCSDESWNIGYLDERVDTDYDIYLGRAELADAILKIIGEEMHKKLGNVKWEEETNEQIGTNN